MIKRAMIVGILLMVTGYFLTVFFVLHFSLDNFVLPRTKGNTIKLPSPYAVVKSNGNELLIRRYGNEKNKCVIFFPGQHGGMARYERDLFPYLTGSGITVFAVSYPGQDGAKGHAHLQELPKLIQTGLSQLKGVCNPQDAVFIGRSFGSMVAVYQAVHWHPKGLVLDGISPSLSDTIATYMKNHWYLRPACMLPIRRILRRDYLLKTALDKLEATPIIVFQGSLDVKTPLSLAKQAVAGRTHVKLIEIAEATHSNTYMKAPSMYIDNIVTLLDGKPGMAFQRASKGRITMKNRQIVLFDDLQGQGVLLKTIIGKI